MTWPTLGLPPTTGGQPFISPDLSVTAVPISKSGYNITYAGIDPAAGAITGITTCVTAVTIAAGGYDALAAPASPNTTGVRFFGTNENNALFEDNDATPSAVVFGAFPGRAASNGTPVK